MSHSLLNEKFSKFKGQFKEHTHMPTIKNVECVYKHAYFMMLLVCGILKIYTNELICKTGTDSQIYSLYIDSQIQRNLWLPKGKGMGEG